MATQDFDILSAKINIDINAGTVDSEFKALQRSIDDFFKEVGKSGTKTSDVVKAMFDLERSAGSAFKSMSVAAKTATSNINLLSQDGKNLSLVVNDLTTKMEKLRVATESRWLMNDYNKAAKEEERNLIQLESLRKKYDNAVNSEKIADVVNLQKQHNAAIREQVIEEKELAKIKTLQARLIASTSKEVTNATILDQSITDFNTIQENFVNFDRGLKQVANDAVNSFSLMAAGGDKLTAVRQIFFGLGESSSFLSKSLNTTGNIMSLFSRDHSPRLVKALKATASQMADTSISINVLNDRFKDIAKAEIVDPNVKGRFNELTGQVKNMTNEYQRLHRIVLTGGKASQAEIDRLKVEFQATQQVIKLTANDYDRLGAEGKQAYDKLISSVNSSKQAISLLEAQSNSLNQSQEKTKANAIAIGKEMDEAGTKGVSIWTRFLSIFKSADSEVDQLNNSLKATNTTMGKTSQLGEGFRDVMIGLTGGLVGGGLALAVPALFEGLRNKLQTVITAASDANEQMSRFAVVFDSDVDPAVGNADSLVQSVIVKIDEMAAAMGRSKYEMRDMAAKFQDTFVPLGFGREESAKLSIELTRLTQDLSSFYNMTEKEVSDRVSSFLVGNYENARAFGAQVNDATLNAELLKMGVEGGTRSIDLQTKALVAMKLLYQGTGDAMNDAIETSDQFANMMRTIQGRAHDAAVELGLKFLPILNPILATMIRLSNEVGPRISAFFANLYGTIQPVVDTLTQVISGGNIDQIINTIINLTDSGISSLINMLDSFIPYAQNWAYSWGIEIYNGLIEFANGLLQDALGYIGSVIASFMEPGSPPDQGPLSTIDKWGGGLVETFIGGMTDADFSLLDKVLDPIAESFKKMGETGKQQFREVAVDMAKFIDNIGKTGEFDETMFGNIVGKLPEEAKASAEALRSELKDRADIAKLENQINKIKESGGEVPEELLDRLEIAKEELRIKEVAETRLASLDSKVETKEQSRAKALQQAAQAIGAANKGMEKYKKTALETYNEELALLETQYAARKALAKTPEEVLEADKWYLSQKANIESKWLKSEENADKVASANRIALYEQQVDEISAKLSELRKSPGGSGAGGKIGLADLGLSVEDFLPEGTDLTTTATDFGTKLATTVTTAFTDTLEKSKTNITNRITSLFTDTVTNIRNFFAGLTPEQILPVSIVAGILAVPLIYLGAGVIGTIATALGGLGVILAGLAAPLLIFVVAATAAYLIITNWTEVTALANTLLEGMGKLIQDVTVWVLDFINGFLQGERVERIFSDLSITWAYLVSIGEKLFTIFSNIFGVFIGIVDLALGGVFSGLAVALSDGEASGNAFGTFVELLIERFNRLLESINSVLTFITDGSILVKLEEIRASLAAAFSEEGPLGFLTRILERIKVVWAESFASISTESTVLTDIMNLFWKIINDINVAIIQNEDLMLSLKNVMMIIGGIVGTVVAVAFGLLVGLIEGLGAAIPYVVGVLEGLIGVFTGLYDIIYGSVAVVLEGLTATFLLLTGDVDGASEHFGYLKENIARVGKGIGETFTGLKKIVISAVGAIVAAVVEFSVGFGSATADLLGFTDWAENLRTIGDQVRQIFLTLYNDLVGHSIIPDTIKDIVWYFTGLGPQLVSQLTTMATDLVNGFIQMGKDMIAGLTTSLGDFDISSSLGGWFGGEETATPMEGTSGIDAIEGIDPAMALTTIDALLLKTQELISMIQTGWTTVVTDLTLAYGSMITDRLTRETAFYSLMSIKIAQFITQFTSVLLLLKDGLMWIVNEYVHLNDTIVGLGTNADEVFSHNISILNDLIKVIEFVTKAYEKMKIAAREAAGGSIATIKDSGIVLDSFAKGTPFVPETGMYELHMGEAVLNADDAARFRTIIAALDSIGSSSGLSGGTTVSRVNNAGSNQSDSSSSQQVNYQVNIDANYQNSQSPSSVFDDVNLALRLVGNGI